MCSQKMLERMLTYLCEARPAFDSHQFSFNLPHIYRWAARSKYFYLIPIFPVLCLMIPFFLLLYLNTVAACSVGDLLTSASQVFSLDETSHAEADATESSPPLQTVATVVVSFICNVWGFLSCVLNNVAAALRSLLPNLIIHPLTFSVQRYAVVVQVLAVIWWSSLIVECHLIRGYKIESFFLPVKVDSSNDFPNCTCPEEAISLRMKSIWGNTRNLLKTYIFLGKFLIL